MVESSYQTSEFGDIICPQNAYPCYKPLNKKGESWKLICCAGYVIEVGIKLFELLDYDWLLYLVPDNFYGSYTNCSSPTNLTGCNWNGLVNEVFQGHADLAMAAITANSQRITIVDFTETVLIGQIAIAVKMKSENLTFVNWDFMKSLDWTLLVALLVALCIVCAMLYLFEKILNPLKHKKHYPTEEAFSYGAGLTFQRDLAGKTPNRWSSRILAIVYAVALTIIMTTYTANLTATNIVAAKDNFKGLKDEKVIDNFEVHLLTTTDTKSSKPIPIWTGEGHFCLSTE